MRGRNRRHLRSKIDGFRALRQQNAHRPSTVKSKAGVSYDCARVIVQNELLGEEQCWIWGAPSH